MSNLFMLDVCKLDLDPMIPSFTTLLVNAIKIVIPIVLIVFGIIEMFRAATANDEKVMKEAQKKLISRIIYAVLIFFIVAIVQLVFSVLARSSENSTTGGSVSKNSISACISCFTNYSKTTCTMQG